MSATLAGLDQSGWGASAKRVMCDLPDGQPLTEVVTQLATVERLLDALVWVEPQRPGATVTCNPTTSSRDPNTLLKGPDLEVHGEERWLFEVSDVAAERNNNDKLDRDLISLGFAPGVATQAGTRRFLVVSPEWSRWISRSTARLWRSRGCERPTADDVHGPVGPNGSSIVELRSCV